MNKSKFKKFRKGAIAALCAVAVTCTGLSAACAPKGPTDNGDSDSSTPRKEDTQLLKNGNFEYSEVPEKGVYLIKNVTGWTRSGDSSGTMSGIINTSEKSWEKITDTGLRATLDANNDLKPGDSDYEEKYVDYNGMDSDDIFYIDPYVASLSESNIGDNEDGYAKDSLILGGGKQNERSYREFLGIEIDGEGDDAKYYFRGEQVYLNEDDGDYYFDDDFTQSVRYAIIDNPQTHYGELKAGEKYSVNGEEYTLLVDEDTGDYYFDIDDDGKIDKIKDESVGNVLMIHNYPTRAQYNGISQTYSSVSLTLEANTAAEISVWVKTSDLKFDKGYLLHNDPVIGMDEQDKGAYIEVAQSVSSNTIDTFKIKAINTQKIIDNAKDDGVDLGENESNGWLKYTIYVNACDFANSTITIKLGLGGSTTNEKITGYAFFDDVEVKKYIDLTEGSFNEDAAQVIFDTANGGENISYCSLLSEAEDKIFYADKQVVTRKVAGKVGYYNRFQYLIDLASEEYNVESEKTAINFDEIAVSTELTSYIDGKDEEGNDKIYASATKNNASVSGLTKSDAEKLLLADALKDEGGRPTFNDLIGIYKKNGNEDYTFSANDFGNRSTDSEYGLGFVDLSGRLNSALSDGKGISALNSFSIDDSNSMLVMFSRYGAAYTTTLGTEGLFTVASNNNDNNYKIISFWVKTSDMNGSTAATIKLVDIADEDHSTTITVDSTKVTTDIGENKDIYSGWVQCFFFIENDTEKDVTFKIEFSFGNTDISSASATSYKAGWAAMANIQSLEISQDIFKIVSGSTYSKVLTVSESGERSHTPFDEATRMHKVKNEIGTPSSYTGVNGGSSYVGGNAYGEEYDKLNNTQNTITGLINRDGFENYTAEGFSWTDIAEGFGFSSMSDAATAWEKIFGNNCYQPLIIIDNLRSYYEKTTDDAEYIAANITEYFTKDKNDVYHQVAAGTEYDENETYYSLREVKNYGYIGGSQTITSGGYVTVSVKVMVTGNAKAYIYLVDDSSYEVMSYEVPEYTYYYDDDGNVLDKEYDSEWNDQEHRNAIVYKLRTDGLYDGEDGKVYANLSNLTTRFKSYSFRNGTFYTAPGAKEEDKVNYGDLEDGVIYYNKDGEIASHYLVADNKPVYLYDSETKAYYYLINGEPSKFEVNNFDTSYARYDASTRVATDYEYKFEVENTGVDANGTPKWVTVNFVIHTGNEAKNYRLELWSGQRELTGLETEEDTYGAVAFDYSNINISSSNYSTVLDNYVTTIRGIYSNLIEGSEDGNSILTTTNLSELNLNELKAMVDKLVEDGKISKDDVTTAFNVAGLDENFVADYYTFSWYDSAKYVPFNLETAEAGQTGYSYTASSYSETLIYFSTRNYSDDSYNMFIDYSAVDNTFSINSDTVDADDDHDHDHDADVEGQSPWLLITSIVLFAVLIFVLIAMLIRYLWKGYSKKHGQKQIQKNNYKTRERYIRKLGLIKAAPVEEEETEAPAEETPIEETPVEEVPAEEAPVEEAPTPAEEAPAEDDKKDE